MAVRRAVGINRRLQNLTLSLSSGKTIGNERTRRTGGSNRDCRCWLDTCTWCRCGKSCRDNSIYANSYAAACPWQPHRLVATGGASNACDSVDAPPQNNSKRRGPVYWTKYDMSALVSHSFRRSVGLGLQSYCIMSVLPMLAGFLRHSDWTSWSEFVFRPFVLN